MGLGGHIEKDPLAKLAQSYKKVTPIKISYFDLIFTKMHSKIDREKVSRTQWNDLLLYCDDWKR